jgi:hypothetical protein
MYLPKRLSIIAPLGALLVSDLFIGFYDMRIMLAVYVSFALMGFIGLWLRTHKAFFNTITGTLVGSLLFFLITNAAVWLFGTMYPHTFAGLMQSYVAAIPFFRNTIAGDLFYVGVLVGSFELFSYWLGVKVFTTKKIAFNQ